MKRFGIITIFVLVPLAALAQAVADPDPAALFEAILAAVQGRHWSVLAGLALTAVTFLVRRFVVGRVPWFQSDRGGAALAIGIAALGALGSVLATGTFSVLTLADALALAMSSAGGYALIRKLLAPSDKQGSRQ